MLAGSTSEAPSLPKLVVGFAATRIGTFGYKASRIETLGSGAKGRVRIVETDTHNVYRGLTAGE